MKFSSYIKKVIAEDRSPVGIIINDKIRVKEYVDERLPGNNLFAHRMYAGYSIPETVKACYNRPCVVRLNNGWHKMRFLFDRKDVLNIDELEKWQSTPYPSAEWSYKQIKPGFTVEKVLPLKHNLFKFFVFHGKVHYIWGQRYNIESRKIGQLGCTMYTPEWKKLNVQWNKTPIIDFKKPGRIDEMISIAEKLWCSDWKFMRVDLYYNDNKILLSEMNNYHAGGTNGFSGDFDEVLGGLI